MNQLQFEEIQYYLKSYGSHKQMLEFLVKYKLVKKACLYLQSKVSSSQNYYNSEPIRLLLIFGILNYELYLLELQF